MGVSAVSVVLATGTLLATSLTVVSTSAQSAAASTKLLKVDMDVKIVGHTFFTEILQGAKAQAAKSGISLTYSGPTFSNAQQQATQLSSILQQGYKVLLLSANSPTVEAPAAKQAIKMGMKVITFDASVIPSATQLYVSDTNNAAFGQCLLTQAAKFAGPKAEFAIVSSNADSPNQIAWIAAAMAYQKAHYPGMKYDGIVYGQGDAGLSSTAAQALINAHPNLRVLLTPDSGAAPGAAEGITKLHKIGKVMSIGQGDLASSRPYILNGSETSCMWNNYGLGVLLDYLAKYAASGAPWPLKNGAKFSQDPAGTWTVHNGVIDYALVPTVFNKQNVNSFTDAGQPKK